MTTASFPPQLSPSTNKVQLDHNLMKSILDSVQQLIQRDQLHIVHPYIQRLLTSNLGSSEYLHSSLELARVTGVLAETVQ